MYNNDLARVIMDQERRLLREIGTQRMSWKKIGKLIQLSALVSGNHRYF